MKISERSCVVCRRRAPKSELLRIVLSDGALVLDLKQNMPGRGGYAHRSWECVSRLGQKDRWERALRMKGDALSQEAVRLLVVEASKVIPEPVVTEKVVGPKGAGGQMKGRVRL